MADDYGYGDGDPGNSLAMPCEVWLCGHCGGENPARQDICKWCGNELESVGYTVQEEDEYEDVDEAALFDSEDDRIAFMLGLPPYEET